jgi:hypothetical protein
MFCTLLTHICKFLSTCAVPSMSVFCSSLISCLHLAFIKYFLDYFEMVAVAPVITGFTLVRTFYTSSLITYLSLKISIFFNIHVPFHYHGLYSPVYCNGRCCRFIILNSTMRLSYCGDVFLLNFLHIHTGERSQIFTPIYLHMLKCSWALTILHLFMYYFLANIGHTVIMSVILHVAYSKVIFITVRHQHR